MEAAAFFAKAPPPRSRGVAVAATSGGASIMAADKAEIHGVALPQPSDRVRAVLEAHIPDFGSARNPCDVTAQVVNNPESLWACGDALLSDECFGALVMPQPVAFDFHKPRIAAFSELSQRYGKITCNVLISDWLQGPATLEAESDPHVAMFRSMDRCFRSIAAWHRRDDRRRGGPRILVRRSGAEAAARAAQLIEDAPHDTLTEREAKAVLAAYGIPVVAERLVHDQAGAAAAAADMGYPVVVKIESPDLPHKTEAGVIRIGIRNGEELHAAFDTVMLNARKAGEHVRIVGVLVQPMIPPGVELMVGARIDPHLGPLILVSLGGIFVDLLKDAALELAPVTASGGPRHARAAQRCGAAAWFSRLRADRYRAVCATSSAACRSSPRISENGSWSWTSIRSSVQDNALWRWMRCSSAASRTSVTPSCRPSIWRIIPCQSATAATSNSSSIVPIRGCCASGSPRRSSSTP